MKLKELRDISTVFKEAMSDLEDAEMNNPFDSTQIHRLMERVDAAAKDREEAAFDELDNLLAIAEAAHEVTLVGHTIESHQAAMRSLIQALAKLGAGPMGEVA
jgi:hypothetical protein